MDNNDKQLRMRRETIVIEGDRQLYNYTFDEGEGEGNLSPEEQGSQGGGARSDAEQRPDRRSE